MDQHIIHLDPHLKWYYRTYHTNQQANITTTLIPRHVNPRTKFLMLCAPKITALFYPSIMLVTLCFHTFLNNWIVQQKDSVTELVCHCSGQNICCTNSGLTVLVMFVWTIFKIHIMKIMCSRFKGPQNKIFFHEKRINHWGSQTAVGRWALTGRAPKYQIRKSRMLKLVAVPLAL